MLPDQTDVRVRLARLRILNILVLSAAMDTLAEAHLAIALAREGGFGIMHCNMSPKDPASEGDKITGWQSGMIVEQMTLPLVASLRQRDSLLIAFG